MAKAGRSILYRPHALADQATERARGGRQGTLSLVGDAELGTGRLLPPGQLEDGQHLLPPVQESLAESVVGAALAAIERLQTRGVRLAAVIALRRLQDPGVARFLDDADPLVVTEAASAINDEGGIVPALPALARVLERTNVTGEPVVRRAISANLRLGDQPAVARVAAYARRSGLPEPLRVEAIATLGVWASPSNMS